MPVLRTNGAADPQRARSNKAAQSNPRKRLTVNAYEQLVGQSFTRAGSRFTIVKVHGATVVAASLQGGRVRRVLVPLADALSAIDITEVQITALPEAEKS